MCADKKNILWSETKRETWLSGVSSCSGCGHKCQKFPFGGIGGATTRIGGTESTGSGFGGGVGGAHPSDEYSFMHMHI